MRSLLIVLAICMVSCGNLIGQTTFQTNGVQDERPSLYAFTGVTLHVDYQTVIENATLIIKDGKVNQVGANIAPPKNAIAYNLTGYHIYPSFIDLHTEYGITPAKREGGSRWDGPQMESNKKGPYGWNQAIKPETEAIQLFKVDEKAAEALRKIGFGVVLTHQNDGIARGSGALVSTASLKDNEVVIKGQASAHYSFDKGSSTQDYPGSLMGVLALLKQTHLDAQWYSKLKNPKEYNLSLEAWNKLQALPQFIEVKHVLNALRADKLGDAFGVQYIMIGNGTEYQRLKELKATKGTVIIPLNFPKPFDVEDPFDALNVSLTEMKHWELAPANAYFLTKQGIPFAITAAGLEDKTKFLEQVAKAIQYGLTEADALKALTATPAQLLGVYDQAGSLERGKWANFLVTNGPIFKKETQIVEHWVQGHKYGINPKTAADLSGKYQLSVGSQTYTLEIKGKPSTPEIIIKTSEADTSKTKVTLTRKDQLVTLTYTLTGDSALVTRLSGLIQGQNWSGKGILPGGTWADWTATYTAAIPDTSKPKTDSLDVIKFSRKKITYPFMAYGWDSLPKAQTVLIRNATVWTNTAQGILKNADVLLKNGKIAQVGTNLPSAGVDRVIDGTGKHLTNGIIDEHSHIAISAGVNEWTQASSAEVSIADVVNSEDINIYRQLGGGVTTAQLLHGSANPIGGQSALIKLRWGYAPEQMKMENAPGFIKFALGENVKQSNWGERNTIRFPQTRMGVEQVFVDYFTRAQEYAAAWKAYNAQSPKTKATTEPPRRDLEMETIVEILEGKRFITCHSYVQSEINMLMKVAERFGFTVNTFTHILEGYKLADKMKEHGVHASTFADWWAYKMEVQDAIPYNASILHLVGVLTAINSDDAEMGRRLNQEAAKSLKYGGMSEEDAWKMVTLNPAKMLRVDNRLGSIEVGKDGDVVLWSDNPLSIYAKVEYTFVDGIAFFELQRDEQMRKQIAAERNRLTQEMLNAKKGGSPTQKPVKKVQKMWHCDDMEGLEELCGHSHAGHGH